MSDKQANLKTQYLKDADLMATKSRFGFFSIYPSNRAGITDYAQKKPRKDQSGRVITGIKGIYSGTRSVRVLSRTCFSQVPSPFIGCPYQDLNKYKRKKIQQQKAQNADKQIFKPARLQKTLMSSAYKYICIKPLDKAKMYRDQNGRVITKNPNICSNPVSKMDYKKDKQFQYKQDPYENKKNKQKQYLQLDLKKRGPQSFKLGSQFGQFFTKNNTLFDDTSNFIKKPSQNQEAKQFKKHNNKDQMNYYKHQASFRPSSGKVTRYNGCFNKLTYKQQGQKKQRPHTAGKIVNHNDSFNAMTKVYNSKPCPSVALNKSNLMRKIR